MLANAKGRELLGLMPIDRVLPETDGPFAIREGVPLMPWEACDIVLELERIWGVSSDEVRNQLHRNLKSLLH